MSARNVLVIGGGAAGLAAALELARRGIPSTVVERSATPGGKANELACKGSPRCVRCDACYPRDLLSEVARDPSITVLTNARVTAVDRRGGGLKATVSTPGGEKTVDAGVAIVATGAAPFDADRDPRLHHDDCPDVLSSDEVEREIAETGGLAVPSTGRPPRTLAILQCVGSRDAARGVPYCSKACCKYAFRLGRHLRSIYPELEVAFFFMDWRPLDGDRDALERWAAEDGRVRVVRSRPSEVIPGDRPVLRYAPPGEFVVEEAFDLVMLTVGLVPPPAVDELARTWGIGRDGLGFLSSKDKAVLVAGTCGGPKDIRESVEEGMAAAGRAARVLEGRP